MAEEPNPQEWKRPRTEPEPCTAMEIQYAAQEAWDTFPQKLMYTTERHHPKCFTRDEGIWC